MLVWDTAWLFVFIGLQWLVVPLWWWFGGRLNDKDKLQMNTMNLNDIWSDSDSNDDSLDGG